MSDYFLIECDENTGNFFEPEQITGLLLISEANKNCGLYKVDGFYLVSEVPNHFTPIPMEMSNLIASAQGYTPAIALTRFEINKMYQNEREASKEVFFDNYTMIIKKYLQSQVDSPYFLAEAKYNSLDITFKGMFNGIVDYDENEDNVSFVTWDYFIYKSSSKSFNLDIDKLKKKFKGK
jgi:hypothetical protein